MDVRVMLGALSNKHFDNVLFPLRTPHEEYLPRYAERLNALELNILRGRKGLPDDVATWLEQAPAKFRFCPKMHKDATDPHHLEQPQEWGDDALDAARDSLALFEPIAEAGKLGPVLVQFPPRFEQTAERLAWLDDLLDMDPSGTFVVEFRHSSWFTPEIERFLRERKTQLVWSTHHKAPSPPWITGPVGYIRLTGKYHKSKETRGRPIHRADRLEELLELRANLKGAPWKHCFVACLNPFEGNALDSLPMVAGALVDPELGRRLSRKPGEALFKRPAGGPAQAGLAGFA